jgi:hypothetical protein
LSGIAPQGFYSVVNVQPIDEKAAWIGDAAGAFVFTLAIANSEQHFKELVVAEFHNDGFAVIDWDKIGPSILQPLNLKLRMLHCCESICVLRIRFSTLASTAIRARA